MYTVLYKLTPTELQGKEDEGSFHPMWGEHYVGWHAQALGYLKTIEDAYKCVERCVAPFGRQWRIIELKEDEKTGCSGVVSVQTSPPAPPYIPEPKEEPKPPAVPGFVELWKKAYAGSLNKTELVIGAAMFSELFTTFIEKKATKEEFVAWNKLILNIMQNEVMPFTEEMGLEEIPFRVQCGMEEYKGDKINLPYFMDEMRSDIRDVAMLRFCGFVTAAQAKQMIRDCWLLGDLINAIKAAKLDDTIDDLAPLVKVVVEANPKIVADYKSGKIAAANSLLGQVIKKVKESGKTADPVEIKKVIITTLDGM